MCKSIVRLASLAALLGLTGCATAKKIIGPDGTENQLISCDEIDGCYEKAREVCGGNYKIVNTSSETSGYNGVTGTTANLLVKCDSQTATSNATAPQKQ